MTKAFVPSSTRSLLLCDDDTEILELLKTGLSLGRDLEVVGEANDGQTAVALAAALRPDVVVLDLGMPIMDGVEALPRIIEAVPAARVVILSGASLTAEEASVVSRHASAFVAKGATISEIIAAIDQALEAPRPESPGPALPEGPRTPFAAGETEPTFKALVQNLRDVVAVLDPTGIVTYVSPVVHEVTGFEVDEVVGENAFSFLHPDDFQRLSATFVDILERPGGSVTTQTRLKSRRDEWIWIEIHATNRVDDPAVGGLLITYNDITTRKQAEEEILELVQEKEHLVHQSRLLLESTGEGIFGINGSGLCTFMNAAAAGMLGGTPEHFIGRAMHDLHHHTRSDGSPYPIDECPIYRAFDTGEAASVDDEVFWRVDGTSFPIEYSAHPMREGEKLSGAVVAFKDITARRGMEEDLRAQEALFRGAFSSAHAGIALIGSDGISYVDVNDALCRMLGYTRDELLRLSWLEVTHPDDRARNIRSTQDFFAGRDDVNLISKRYVRKDGSVIFVEIADAIVRNLDGSPRNFVTHVTDVTERRAAMTALEDSRALLQAVVDSSPALIYIKDREGRYLLVNKSYTELRAKPPEGLLGRTVSEIFSPEIAEKIAAHDVRVFDELVPIEVEESAIDSAGDVRTFLSLRFPLFDSTGECYAICGVDTDITDRVRAEEERQALETQLRQAQKMEAVGQLAGGIAHDFNNVLAVILNYAEFLAEDLGEHDPRAGDVQEISNAAQRAVQLVRQLLTFSRKEVLEERVMDLNEVVCNLQTLLERTVGEDVVLRFEPADGLPPIAADQGQLEQIVLNLVVNARDAMPKGGSITVSTSQTELGAEERPGIQPGTYSTLAVSDTGSGMEASTVERIFEPFFTTKPRGKGTGLGLATVYGIVKRSGGGIWVDSTPGEGTTFTICFPALRMASLNEKESEDEIR